MTNPSEPVVVTQPGPFRRALLKTIASANAPTPRGIRFEPEPCDDGNPMVELRLELEGIADLRRWLVVLGAEHEEVLIEHRVGCIRASSWAHWNGIGVALTAEDPDGPGGGAGVDAGDVDDLADVALLGVGEDYHSDPDERIAAVAEAAPAYVRPVPVPVGASAAAAVLDEGLAVRRAGRGGAVTAGLAAGCPPPAHVEVSEDGWSLRIELADEAAVVVWAGQLDLTDAVSSRVRRQRGAVKRITSAGRDHPWSVQVVCTVDVALPPAPPLADDIVSLAWQEREARPLAVAVAA
ncbi:hypothetical protein K1W54_13310 [Micromonospora sp. CPCC 205371]|nr:hypothetical protein [Micromonospora sp. CPCC 205371]